MKPFEPYPFSFTSSSNFSTSVFDPSSITSNLLSTDTTSNSDVNNNSNYTPATLIILPQRPLPPLPTSSTRTNNPITRLTTRNPYSSAAVLSNTSTTKKGLITTQRTKIIKTFVSPKGSTKIILMTTITTIQEPVFNKENKSWVMRRTTEIRKVMVRKRLRPSLDGKKSGIVKRRRRPAKGKGRKGMKKGSSDSL